MEDEMERFERKAFLYGDIELAIAISEMNITPQFQLKTQDNIKHPFYHFGN